MGAAAAAGTMAAASMGAGHHSPRAVAAAAAATALFAAQRAAGPGGAAAASPPRPVARISPSLPPRRGEAGGSAPAPAGAGGPLSGLLAQDKPPVPRRTSSSRSLRGKPSQADSRQAGPAALRQPLLEAEHEGEGSSGHGSWQAGQGLAGEQQEQDGSNPQLALHARQQQHIEAMLRQAREAEAGVAGTDGTPHGEDP